MISNFSLDFVFTYLHSYDYFKELHIILCSLLKEDNEDIDKMCDKLTSIVLNSS